MEPDGNYYRDFMKLFAPQSVIQGRSIESEEGMVLQAKEPRIEALHSYPASLVEELDRILNAGAPAREDPRRKDFFELESDAEVFYVHVSPMNGRILLLGVWAKSDLPHLMSDAARAA
jgi:hypothetical protein